ncbi:MAG: DNA gyrase inhibitor YacG [Aquabacterium sp.]
MTAPARTCPVCGRPTAQGDNPFRPFCGQRCRTIDLGAWASGMHRIAGEPASDILTDADVDAGSSEDRPPTRH